jgi:hypothetical protein
MVLPDQHERYEAMQAEMVRVLVTLVVAQIVLVG